MLKDKDKILLNLVQ